MMFYNILMAISYIYFETVRRLFMHYMQKLSCLLGICLYTH